MYLQVKFEERRVLVDSLISSRVASVKMLENMNGTVDFTSAYPILLCLNCLYFLYLVEVLFKI